MLFAGPHFARQRLRPPGAAALPSPQSVLWHESENGGRGGLRARRRTRSVLIPTLRRGSLREGSPLIAGAVVFRLPERRLARRLGGGAQRREVRIIYGMLDDREAPQYYPELRAGVSQPGPQ